MNTEVNFGGNQRWYTRRYQPSSEAEVLDILARHSGQTIRVLGSKHSWSNIAADAAVSIDMSRLDGVELIERNGEPVVRVGAGCRLQDLLDWLHERTDRTLPTLGAIKKQTISGAISTGTHGSGRQSLSHYVARIRAAVFDAASGQPAIREFSEGPELKAARCGLGCMGVILAVELPTVRKFKIAETVRIRQNLDEILGLYADQPLTQFFLGALQLGLVDVRAAAAQRAAPVFVGSRQGACLPRHQSGRRGRRLSLLRHREPKGGPGRRQEFLHDRAASHAEEPRADR